MQRLPADTVSAGRQKLCTVVGDKTVGKTCMLKTYTTNCFPIESAQDRLYHDNHDVTLMCDGISVTLELSDAPGGSAERDRIRQLFYPKADVILICFSVVSPSSFENVTAKWYPEIRHHLCFAPLILVGTKIDLRDDKETLQLLEKQSLSPIKKKQGQNLASEIGAVQYLECSALTKIGLKQVFDEVVKEVMRPPETLKKQNKKCELI